MARILPVLFITLSVLHAAWGSALHAADECTGLGDLGIIGGKNASITELPSAVSVLIKIQDKFVRVCGGSIVDERFILTSATCTFMKNNNMTVRFGSTNLNSGGDVADVEKVIQHEDYQEKNMTNDIALLKLAKPITFGWLAKAQLPTKGLEIKEGTQANFTGWGGDIVNNTMSEVLREVTLPIKPRKCCNSPNFAELTDAKRICAGKPGAKPYTGDGGSPLTQNGVLIGIESYGSGIEDNKPYVFTNVASYLDWIDAKINETH